MLGVKPLVNALQTQLTLGEISNDNTRADGCVSAQFYLLFIAALLCRSVAHAVVRMHLYIHCSRLL
jgi:hypothetical protein